MNEPAPRTFETAEADATATKTRTRSRGGVKHRKRTPVQAPEVAAAPVAEVEAEAPVKKPRTRTRGGVKHRKKTPVVAPDTDAQATPFDVAPEATATKTPTRTRRGGGARQPEPTEAYDDVAPARGISVTEIRARIPVTGTPIDVPAPFAHNAEYEFARILDFYGIQWIYEPRSFPLRWEKGHVTEAFTPDFYLPDLDLFVELTTLKSGLTAEKNRKMREIQELYPDTKIMMLKKRDYLRLLAKYGYGPLSPSQVPDVDHVLFTATKIQQRVAELGVQISRDYAGREPVLVGVLRGVICFIADLMRHISVPTNVDLMAVSSYDGTGQAAVRIQKDLDINIKGRDVILVEDIVDTGMTLNHIVDYLQTKRPASVKVCTLLDKRARRLIDVPLEYVGFEIPDEFVVGYGLDFHQRFRNLPFIGTLKHDLLP